MKKKILILASALVLAIGWCVQYFNINHTFALHDSCDVRWYGMHELVNLDNSMSYGGIDQTGYAFSVENCRIVDAEDFMTEYGKTPDQFSMVPERYLVVTMNIANHGEGEGSGINFFSLPVMGNSWYTMADPEATACANSFYNGAQEAYGVAALEDTSVSVTVVYRLYAFMFPESRWENLEDENMCIWSTVAPIQQKVQLQFD